MRYDIGDRAVLRATFHTSDGTLVDPTTVRVFLRVGDTEQILTYGVDVDVIKDGVGQYHYDWPLTVSGEHCYRWVGTGAAHAAGEARLTVAESYFTAPI